MSGTQGAGPASVVMSRIAVLTAAGVVILPNTDPWSEWVKDDQLGT